MLRSCVFLLSDCVYTYCNLLHEDCIGGFRFVQQAVHMLHTACRCGQLLAQLLLGRLRGPYKWFWKSKNNILANES